MPVHGSSLTGKGRHVPKTPQVDYSEPTESPFSTSSGGHFSCKNDLKLKNGARIARYRVLKGHGCEERAMEILREVGREVRGVMRGRGWFCPLVVEFNGAPGARSSHRQLLGMNMNAGQKIYLRLRELSSTDVTKPIDSFLPLEEIISTMLHELTHNVRGPHDEIFQRTLDELHEEYFESKRQRARNGGRLDGEAFDTPGTRLGGWAGSGMGDDPLIRHVGRKAAEQAEKRRAAQLLMSGGHGGVRLGGTPSGAHSPSGEAVAAASRRLKTEQQCPSTAAEQEGAVRWHEEEELRHGIKVITILDDDDDDGGSGETEKGQSIDPQAPREGRQSKQASQLLSTGNIGGGSASSSKAGSSSPLVGPAIDTSRPVLEPIAIDSSSDEEGPQSIADDDDNDDDFQEVRAVIIKKPRLASSSSKSRRPAQGTRQTSSASSSKQQQQHKAGPLARESIAAKVALETYRAMQARRAQERQVQGSEPSCHPRPTPHSTSTPSPREREAGTELNSWTCQSCTLCNAPNEGMCEACASPRPGLGAEDLLRLAAQAASASGRREGG